MSNSNKGYASVLICEICEKKLREDIHTDLTDPHTVKSVRNKTSVRTFTQILQIPTDLFFRNDKSS